MSNQNGNEWLSYTTFVGSQFLGTTNSQTDIVPLSLSKYLKDRLGKGAYDNDSIGQFAKDLRTLTANAKEYNRKGSPIHRDATTLEVINRGE